MELDRSLLNNPVVIAGIRRFLKNNSEAFHLMVQAALEVGIQFSGGKKDKPTPRQEANAMLAYAVRNSASFENHHASGDPMLNAEVKAMMVEGSERLEQWLIMKRDLERSNPLLYNMIVHAYLAMYAKDWDGSESTNDRSTSEKPLIQEE